MVNVMLAKNENHKPHFNWKTMGPTSQKRDKGVTTLVKSAGKELFIKLCNIVTYGKCADSLKPS